MSRLHIVKYPDPVLRKKAVPVARVTLELHAFIDEMADLMYEANGVGLAAPQVGVSLRLIIVDVDDRLQPLINPQLLTLEGSQTGVEGCLSLPNLHGEVTRAERVVLTGLSPRGKKLTLSGDGLWARAMQHEIDHLDGVLFTDKVDPTTMCWVTGETDPQGRLIERPTSLEEALKTFEREACALKA
jgi:peptide deformylase